MKNILLIWLTALIPLMTAGQKVPAVVEIDLSNYVTQDKVNSLEKRIQALESGSGVVKPVEPVVPGKDDCKAGLKIISITKITNTSANVTFDAVDARSIDYRIVSALDTTRVHSFGNVSPNTSQFPISYASLTPGQYRLLIDAVNCNGHSGRNFTIPGIPPIVSNCPRGPNLLEAEYSLQLNESVIRFDGEGVTRLVVDTRNQAGQVVQSDTINPSSSSITVKYNTSLASGLYSVTTTGVSCKGGGDVIKYITVPSGSGGVIDPVKPTPNPGSRNIFMNTTGNGFDSSAPYGIMPSWVDRIEKFTNLNHNGEKFSAITGLRLTVPWLEYEKKPGQYEDAAMLRVVDYCIKKNLVLEICVIPELRYNDGMFFEIDMSQVARPYFHDWFQKQTKIYFPYLDVYVPTFNSESVRNRLATMVKHMTEVLKSNKNSTYRLTYLGWGNTEEFYNAVQKNTDHTMAIGGVGYGPLDVQAWNAYTNARGLGIITPPVPDAITFGNAWYLGDFWNSTSERRLWYEFTTDSMTRLFTVFRDAVHAGGGLAGAVIADCGGAQSSQYMTFNIHRLFPGADKFYSSDGGTKYQADDKLLAIDFGKGTFPEAIHAAEFDPEDMRLADNVGNMKYAEQLDWNLWETYSNSILSRGGDLHFAMAYSSGIDGQHDNISSGTAQMYRIWKKHIVNNNPDPITIAEPIRQKIESYSGDQPYRYNWKKRASLSVSVLIVTY